MRVLQPVAAGCRTSVRGLKKIRRETSVCIVAVEAFSVQRKESEERAEAIQFEPLVQKGIKKTGRCTGGHIFLQDIRLGKNYFLKYLL
jgi:hypothetical protein